MQPYSNIGSLYTCTRCGTVSAIPSQAAELSAKCCQGDSPVLHKKGKIEIAKPATKIVAPSPVVVEGTQLPVKPESFNPSAPTAASMSLGTPVASTPAPTGTPVLTKPAP